MVTLVIAHFVANAIAFYGNEIVKAVKNGGVQNGK